MAGPAAEARPHRPLLQTIGLGAGLHQSGFYDRVARQVDQERVVVLRRAIWATLIGTAILAVPAAAEAPKYGGTLTYMIPADAPPSFDGHRESTYATVHSVAPFYSVLIRVNPENPSVTTEFVCDLCTEIPQPSEDGKTYTFKIRGDVKFHDGVPLTAADVAASLKKIICPADGMLIARSSNYLM